MILARLAMGTGWPPPCAPSRPVPGRPTAACAPPGQPGRGAAPGRARTVVTDAARAIGATGRNNCTATHATPAARTTAPAISARDHSRRLPAAARRGSARRPARRGSTVPPPAARGRNFLRRMTHHHNNRQPPGPARPRQAHREPQRLHSWQQPCYPRCGTPRFAGRSHRVLDAGPGKVVISLRKLRYRVPRLRSVGPVRGFCEPHRNPTTRRHGGWSPQESHR